MMDAAGRIAMTTECLDCSRLAKVSLAGEVMRIDGHDVQVMHNGIKVLAGGYHGDWMMRVIQELRGHHEPQEELVFDAVLPYVRRCSIMVELGAFWSYYSIWFVRDVEGARALCVEPDPSNLSIGRQNVALNGLEPRIEFCEAWIGGSASTTSGICETTGLERMLPLLDFPAVSSMCEKEPIELLHMDVQGAEHAFLTSMQRCHVSRSVRFIFVATHHAVISGCETTHDDCLAALTGAGASILVDIPVHESFSGDGLILASFEPQDRHLPMPRVSRNRKSNSLFG